MYLSEQYTFYKLAHSLVAKDDFEILHINESGQEIWLEKYENKTSYVVRLLHRGFDWKNHLKKDIRTVFQKAKAMKHFFLGKHIEIHNVYISTHSPVDDWNILKKPMQLNEKNPLKMKVYYLSEAEKAAEQSRLQDAIGSSSVTISDDDSELDMEEQVEYYKSQLDTTLKNKKNEAESLFSNGKPFLTYFLLGINILVFLLLELNGGSKSTETLIEFGAKYNPAIIENGEWWRIITSMFLHIGFLHLIMNMFAVYYLGAAVERIYGSTRSILVYFLAGIGGGLASFAFTTNISAGASGALFGLFGALLFFGLIHKKIFFQTMGKSLLIIIGINLVFGFMVPQVDNGAHLGGLISGFVASAILHLPQRRKLSMQLFAFILYAVIILGLIIFGTQHNLNSPSYQLLKVEQLASVPDYEEIVEVTTIGLRNSEDLADILLFQRSYAYVKLNEVDLAIDDLESAIQMNDEFAEAHFNLAVLYYNKGQENKAQERIREAYEIKPDSDDIKRLYEQIIDQ
ncbi:rhomboid family intramembrane serine protease [Virgibacillus sp. JSM 102003]|uniref:rhomboid family intramembrane serine protease n=1 Tax=Virgibacillus sp. JSM 102003 TaxID=1562108 RepID=UPI0035BFE1CF